MKRLVIFVFGAMLLASCKQEEVKPEDVALQAAKVYYEQLLAGDYNSFVDGTLKGDSVPQAYRQQLLLNMQMFMERQKAEHKGIASVKPIRAVADTAAHTAETFLSITYADSTREEIVVPMVERKGVWYMR